MISRPPHPSSTVAERAGEARPDLRPLLPDNLDENRAYDLDEAEDLQFAALIYARWALFAGALALIVAALAPLGSAFAYFLALGTFCSFRAIAHTNRADSILQRSLAASLVEEGPAVLSEAA